VATEDEPNISWESDAERSKRIVSQAPSKSIRKLTGAHLITDQPQLEDIIPGGLSQQKSEERQFIEYRQVFSTLWTSPGLICVSPQLRCASKTLSHP
jgi:hypothetical protein